MGFSGNVFANPVASSSPYPKELNPWSSGREEPIHSSTVEKSERQTPIQDQRYQSGPSAKTSVIFSEGDSSKDYGADQQRLQISDPHFDKFPTLATFACWKVDDLKSSRSIGGTPGPDFELLYARIASALNRIIQNTRFKKKISLEEIEAQKKEDRFLRGRQIAYLIY